MSKYMLTGSFLIKSMRQLPTTALAESMKASLEKGECFHITTVTYDEDGDEVEMETEAIAA